MRRRYWNGVILVILMLPWALPAAAVQQPRPSAKELDAALEEIFARDLSPGMAVAVVQGNAVVYARGFGFADLERKQPVTPDTMFYIASTTKSFTAFAAVMLDRRKKIGLDTSIDQYLPTLRLKAPLDPTAITVRDLLTHTHGIENAFPVGFRTSFTGRYDSALLIRLLADYGPAQTGRAFVYSNTGYNIAGLILDGQAKGGWKEVLEKEIFVPLQMKDTTAYVSKADQRRLALPYQATETGYERLRYKTDATMHAAGGHISSANDLARWITVHLDGGRFNGKQVFPKEVIAETHRSQATQDRAFGPYRRTGWGLGWDIGTYDGDLFLHRFGAFAGFRSHVSFMPERGIGVVVLTNESSLGSPLADYAATTIYDMMLAKPTAQERRAKTLAQTDQMAKLGRESIGKEKARRAARSQQLAHPREGYAGTFQNDAVGCMNVRLENGAFQFQIGDAQSTAEVYDGSKDQLRVELTGSGDVITFTFEGDNAVSLKYAGREFTKQPCR